MAVRGKGLVVPEREVNPICELLPEQSAEEYADMLESIKRRGQIVPIQLDAEGRILDGRMRHRACRELMIAPKMSKWVGAGSDEAYVAYVIGANLARRNLTVGQKAIVIARLGDFQRGGDRKSSNFLGKSKNQSANLRFDRLEDAAKSVGVSPRSVDMARRVLRENPELASAVERGEKTLGAAAAEAVADGSTGLSAEPMTDPFGNVLPDCVSDAWNDALTIVDYRNTIDRIRRSVEAMCERGDKIVAFLSLTSWVADMKNAARGLRCAMPYCLCPNCSGTDRATCQACRKQGWMPREWYEQTVVKELQWKKPEK